MANPIIYLLSAYSIGEFLKKLIIRDHIVISRLSEKYDSSKF